MEDVLDLYEEPYNPRRPKVNFAETSKQLERPASRCLRRRDSPHGTTMHMCATAPATSSC
jgi:hypothetical protein